MTIVTVDHSVYGQLDAVALEIGETEIVIEMGYLPPLGTVVMLAIGDVPWGRAEVIGHSYAGEFRRLVRMRFVDAAETNAPASVQ